MGANFKVTNISDRAVNFELKAADDGEGFVYSYRFGKEQPLDGIRGLIDEAKGEPDRDQLIVSNSVAISVQNDSDSNKRVVFEDGTTFTIAPGCAMSHCPEGKGKI